MIFGLKIGLGLVTCFMLLSNSNEHKTISVLVELHHLLNECVVGARGDLPQVLLAA